MTTTIETNQAVFDKIAKLLAMANDSGASENEAQIAAAHVQRLLQLHNLSLGQVETASGKSSSEKRDKVAFGSAVRPWQVTVMAALAQSNFCLHQVSKSQQQGVPSKHLIVGRPVNVEATRLTYDYILGALRRALREAGYTETEPRPNSRGTRYSKEGQWFLEGAAQRLSERLEQRRKEAEAESAAREAERQTNGSGRELVLSDVYGTEADLNNDALNNFPVGTTAARRRKEMERQAELQRKHDEYAAQGVESTEAWYLAYGYDVDQARSYAKAYNRRSQTRHWTRGSSNHARMVNSAAYRSGKSAGNSIGLDRQVAASKAPKLIGG